jgi:hypothetical protein
VVWRTAVLAAYIGLPLACCIAWGGWAWFLLFAVWGLVWFGFSLFWGWAQRARREVLKRSTSG